MQVQLKRLERRGGKKKIKPNCYRCLNSSRRSPTFGILPDGQLYCSVWQCIVMCSQAKICPEFLPNSPPRKEKKKFGRW